MGDNSALNEAINAELLNRVRGREGWQPIETAPIGKIVEVWGMGEDERDDAYDDEREPVYAAYPAKQGPQPNVWWVHGFGLRQIEDPTHWRPLSKSPLGDNSNG